MVAIPTTRFREEYGTGVVHLFPIGPDMTTARVTARIDPCGDRTQTIYSQTLPLDEAWEAYREQVERVHRLTRKFAE